jgi:glycosyltransferase involved in cell wall biosynthesis
MSRHRAPLDLSIVIPVFNEEASLAELHARLAAVLDTFPRSTEIIFVDDGSTDGTLFGLKMLREIDPAVRIVKLARNYGQTAALAAGFDVAKGDIIVAMDGDLQHAPEDLPKLVGKIDEGYDIASGWRERRVDNLWTRQLPSRLANWLMARLSGVALHDFGTTFKAYRARTVKRIPLYGELHRFIPALASWYGARTVEVPISSAHRTASKSHYGLSRTWRVMADLITVRFLLRYLTRPLHFFGPIGFAALAGGLAGGTFVIAKKILTGDDIFLAHGPLMLLSALLIETGIMLVAIGLLAEILTRIYLDGRHRRIYTVEHAMTGSASKVRDPRRVSVGRRRRVGATADPPAPDDDRS